ncbi:MAG: DUF2752 domain-containing protein [bacterium]
MSGADRALRGVDGAEPLAESRRRVARSLLLREGAVWLGGLAFLAVAGAAESGGRTFCALRNLGFDWCPGCGLGRSVALLFLGRVAESFATHPLGGAAVFILVARIAHLLYRSWPRFQSKGNAA